MSSLYSYAGFLSRPENAATGYVRLQRNLLRICILNFVVLALVGLLLRSYPLFSIPVFAYKNVLHAHSHFAFGGWVMPGLLLLVLKFFQGLRTNAAYHHWRNIIILTLLSAYGMLLSFPFQGYGLVSIVFSTLSIAAGLYAGWLTWTNRPQQFIPPSWLFLRSGFFYFLLSAVGPFATGPLIAMNMVGSEIYFNAIYFYLHFQYNGFFTFIILAVLYRIIERSRPFNNGKRVWWIMNMTCIPAFALSILWTGPPLAVNIIGGFAALLQLSAIVILYKDLVRINLKQYGIPWLLRLAMAAFLLKCILQLVSAFPQVADLAFQNRNFIIAYLHLVLVGFTSIFICSILFKLLGQYQSKVFHAGIVCFLVAFTATELVMVLQAAGYLRWLGVEAYQRSMFLFSILFPTGILLAGAAGQKLNMYFPVRSLEH